MAPITVHLRLQNGLTDAGLRHLCEFIAGGDPTIELYDARPEQSSDQMVELVAVIRSESAVLKFAHKLQSAYKDLPLGYSCRISVELDLPAGTECDSAPEMTNDGAGFDECLVKRISSARTNIPAQVFDARADMYTAYRRRLM